MVRRGGPRTEALNVSRPGRRRRYPRPRPGQLVDPAPNRFHLRILGVLVLPELVASAPRLMISSAPIDRHSSALRSLETTQTGIALLLSAYWVADAPSRRWPRDQHVVACFIAAPLSETIRRNAAPVHQAAWWSSPRSGARPGHQLDLVDHRQLWPGRRSRSRYPRSAAGDRASCRRGWSELSSSTDRQCATTSSPAARRCTRGRGEHDPGQVLTERRDTQVTPAR